MGDFAYDVDLSGRGRENPAIDADGAVLERLRRDFDALLRGARLAVTAVRARAVSDRLIDFANGLSDLAADSLAVAERLNREAGDAEQTAIESANIDAERRAYYRNQL